MKIKIGIAGYGNIGAGAEKAIAQSADMELAAVFTKRDPSSLKINTPNVPVYNFDEIANSADKIDVMLLCGGSAKDLPEQGPYLSSLFNTVDSFDTHAKIPEYLEAMDKSAVSGGKSAVISVGWDPGLFSMMRLIGEAILPVGNTYTFWGRGVSQGHSEAIRRLDGIKKDANGKKIAVQYTVPSEIAMNAVRNGENPELSVRGKHLRECYVAAEDGADLQELESGIKNMPDYFAPYDTIVHFISENEFAANHSKMPHGGFVFRSGTTGADDNNSNKQIMEFALKLESNPEFTASVMLAYARATVRLSREGRSGAFTVFDVPLSYLSPKDSATLIKELL